MSITPLHSFLSDESIALHKEHLRDLRLRYSILTKSVPQLLNKSISNIRHLRLPKDVIADAVSLLSDITSHEVYFESFVSTPAPCREIKRYFSSEAGFAYEIFALARKYDSGFIYVFSNRGGAPEISHSSKTAVLTDPPALAIDICEHAYFLDYRFGRDEYLRRAASHLDASKILPSNT